MAGLQGRAQAEANVSEEGTAPAHGARRGWPAGDPDPTGHDSGHQAQPRPRARKRGASSPLPVRKPRSTHCGPRDQPLQLASSPDKTRTRARR